MKMNSLNKVLSLVILAIMMVSCGSAEDAKKHQDQQEIILKSHIISNRVQIDLAKNNGNDLKNLTVNDKLDFNLKSADQISGSNINLKQLEIAPKDNPCASKMNGFNACGIEKFWNCQKISEGGRIKCEAKQKVGCLKVNGSCNVREVFTE